MSTPYGYLADLLGDEDEVEVPLGAIGGTAASGWTRYATVRRHPESVIPNIITVWIYGNMVAKLSPNGAIRVRTCGYYTPSTRAAIALALGRPWGGNGSVSMRTPGSRGGRVGPWRAIVHHEGETYEVGDDWTDVGRANWPGR